MEGIGIAAQENEGDMALTFVLANGFESAEAVDVREVQITNN